MTADPGLIARGWWSAFRDVALVVLSILIAFGLDAWWQGVVDRRDERTVLAGLRADFAANRLLLREAIASHTRALESTLGLLEVMGPSATFDASLQPVVDGLLGTHTFDPVRGTLDDLVGSGRLGLIRDDSLRTMLAAWPSWVEDATEEEVEGRRHVEQQISPLVGRRMPLRNTAVSVGLVAGLDESGFRGAPDELLRSLEFESMLVSRAVLLGIVMEEEGSLEGRLAAILERIEQILAQ